MKKKIYSFIYVLVGLCANAQTTQLTIGATGAHELFYDVKFDTVNGGTVIVGSVYNLERYEQDCFIVKMDANKNPVWQKTIPQPGEDLFTRVIVCRNGDYLAIGYITNNNVRRAIACRINSSTGNIIWTAVSGNSPAVVSFSDVTELPNQTIALVGNTNFNYSTANGFVVLLNGSTGAKIWSAISFHAGSDGFFNTVSPLSNGNILICGSYKSGSIYGYTESTLDILELNPVTHNIVTQTGYQINTSVPAGGPGLVNAISASQSFVRNNRVVLSFDLYQLPGSVANHAVCVYNPSTQSLSGNIYYHAGNNYGNSNLIKSAYSIYPQDENDIFITQPSTNTGGAFLSRVKNGAVVFDKKTSSEVLNLATIDINPSGTLITSGAYLGTHSTADGFALYSNTGLSAGGNACAVSDANTLTNIPLSLTPLPGNYIALIDSGDMTSSTLSTENYLSVTGTICPILSTGAGSGLLGSYFNGTELSGEPLLRRVDSSINFEFTYSKQPVVMSPAPGIVPEDRYSVRWTGQVQPLYTENYTFTVNSDDGVRLWVNGVQLIDNWTNQSATEKSGSIILQGGLKYDIKLEYFENTGEAVTKLYWAGRNTPKQIIPSLRLYPTNIPPPVGNGTGLRGNYYNGSNLTGEPLLSRVDTAVNMELTYSNQPLVLSPAPGIVPEDHFSVRWSGKVQAQYTDLYTFYTQSDDGVRLWVNGEQLIDNWTNQGVTEKNGSIALQAGQKYDIVMEYYENTGEAVAKLLWSSSNTAKKIVPASQLFSPAPPAATGSGKGLTGYYFSGKNRGTTGAPILLTRIDSTVNFEFTYSKFPQVLSPAPGIVPEDNYSVDWLGYVEPQYSETYTFYTVCDDGVRLYVDRLLIDSYQDQGPTEYSNTIRLEAGQKYLINMQYYENAGEAVAKLYWSSASTPKQIIPKSQLYAFDYYNTRTVLNNTILQTNSTRVDEPAINSFSAVINPNPVKSGQAARLQVTSNKTGRVIVTVMSSNGNRINTRSLNLVKGSISAGISTSGLTQGLYFVNITGGEKPITVKLVVD